MAASRFTTFLDTFDPDPKTRGTQWERVCNMNAKQQRFVAEHAIDFNATQAAVRLNVSVEQGQFGRRWRMELRHLDRLPVSSLRESLADRVAQG